MKRMAILAGVLALGLGACTQNGGVNLGQGFGMDANVTGADVSVAVQSVKDSSGNVTGYSSVYTLTQPTVTFNAQPQSAGFTVQAYTVEVLDGAGARYADAEGKYQRSVSYKVQPGFTCTSGTLDACSPNDKVASAVSTSLGQISVVSDGVARAVTNDCNTAGNCPNLKLKITFTGVDDAGRAQTVVSSATTLNVVVASRS